jgi:hypothetical protein
VRFSSFRWNFVGPFARRPLATFFFAINCFGGSSVGFHWNFVAVHGRFSSEKLTNFQHFFGQHVVVKKCCHKLNFCQNAGVLAKCLT